MPRRAKAECSITSSRQIPTAEGSWEAPRRPSGHRGAFFFECDIILIMIDQIKSLYQGAIIGESLSDERILNSLDLTSFTVTEEEDPAERWHIYKVLVTREDIKRLAQNIKPGWYMHFWLGREVIVAFASQQFEFNYDNKKSWQPAIDYGLSMGIPLEQLDFPIDKQK